VNAFARCFAATVITGAAGRSIAGVLRGAVPAPAAVQAALRVSSRQWTEVYVTQGEQWSARRGRGYSYVKMPVPTDTLHAASCLLLLAAGDERWRGAGLLGACARTFRVAEEGIAEHLRVAKANGGLAELATQLDATLVREEIPMSRSR